MRFGASCFQYSLLRQVAVIAFASCLASAALLWLLPSLFYCPRWAVQVSVLPAPAPATHIDAAAPFANVTRDLRVVTAASAPFYDRLQNMVGSLHTWEPHQQLTLLDLGLTQQQLQHILCWRNVDLQRFPFERYPPHVRNIRNYSWKALVMQLVLAEHASILWIDSGLELRSPLSRLRFEMSHHGLVGTLMEDTVGMYALDRRQVDHFGLQERWEEISRWQFCAGGLWGFVRGSDAQRLVLEPVVNCSLAPACMAPHNHSRANFEYDQSAFTIQVWRHNYSCLPRETHCMWSVKKASLDPRQLSDPIEMVSRGHRLPKPYRRLVRYRADCRAENQTPGWVSSVKSVERQARYSLKFLLLRVYLQPVGDFVVMACSCVGFHITWLVLFAAGMMGCARLSSMTCKLETIGRGAPGVKLPDARSWTSTSHMICYIISVAGVQVICWALASTM